MPNFFGFPQKRCVRVHNSASMYYEESVGIVCIIGYARSLMHNVILCLLIYLSFTEVNLYMHGPCVNIKYSLYLQRMMLCYIILLSQLVYFVDADSCPTRCEWLPWTSWNECSATCGGGTSNISISVATQCKCY